MPLCEVSECGSGDLVNRAVWQGAKRAFIAVEEDEPQMKTAANGRHSQYKNRK
jgi:hypothetical protein